MACIQAVSATREAPIHIMSPERQNGLLASAVTGEASILQSLASSNLLVVQPSLGHAVCQSLLTPYYTFTARITVACI